MTVITLATNCLHSVLFIGPLGGEFHPLSFKFSPQTLTSFVCFFGCFHIFFLHKKQFTPKTASLEKTLSILFSLASCSENVAHFMCLS